MNEKFILNVFDKFEKSSAVLLHIKEGEAELTLKKEAAYQSTAVLPISGVSATAPACASGLGGVPADNRVQTADSPRVNGDSAAIVPHAAVDAASANAVLPAASTADTADLVTVKSPIVGSFYRSPSPDTPAYVDKGAKVSKGQPLCILEAMKMMNTLECEYDGTIEDILVANGDLVEFDQPLFLIRV